YNVIYGDAVAWLDAETVDYLTPQLYWPFGGGQDYGKLAPWWASVRNERHLYPGHGLYRSDANTFSGTLFAANEVPRQVRFNRDHPDILGSVFFRAENITRFSSKGFADSLQTDLYRFPALTPPMAWKDQTAPGRPANLDFTWTGTDEGTLTWSPPQDMGSEAETRRYAVYRVRSENEPNFEEAMQDGRNLLAVTGETSITDRPGIASEPYYYVVTAVSANSIEGDPSNVVMAEGRAVAIEKEQPVQFVLHQNYPNPFNPSTEIRFTLDIPMQVSLRVYNALGQEVATLIDADWRDRGTHTVRWKGADNAGRQTQSGVYFYTLDAGTERVTRQMVLIK
ncbi:MAG TPA: FlgD immunoglobulin-like domain containing protein, partial [Rhodothermales bacterium]|nr:FlgD immunoglobulin-like domain containing protein [Rhodothermales bacterium]